MFKVNKKIKVVIFGSGQVSRALAEKLHKTNINFAVVSRKSGIFKGKKFIKISKILNHNSLTKKSILVSTIPPNKIGEDFVLKKIPITTLNLFKKLIYISSTSVYQGGKVDEKTLPLPKTKPGVRRLKIEKKWRRNNFNVSIIRSGGIYNEENNLLTRYLKSDYEVIYKKNHFTNRIHIEDLVGIIFKIINKKKSKGVYNAVDSDFVDNFEIIEKLSKKFDFPKPKKILYNKNEISCNIKQFYKVSKMVFNNRVLRELNYKFKYPKFEIFLNNIVNK